MLLPSPADPGSELDLGHEINPRFPRGIAPHALLAQVRNTAPFIFSPDFPAPPYVRELRLVAGDGIPHDRYFRLCLAAHFATVGTFVPTDVDNQIRFKLWHPGLDRATLERMADTVVESLSWDFRPVTTRWVRSPRTGEVLGGHHGEWFSVAVAAYGAFRRRDPERAAALAAGILGEMAREERIYGDLRAARDGIGLLKAATLIAHNLGDLDRVIEAWHLPEEDPLRAAAFKAGHERRPAFSGGLVEAGRLNKDMMAAENHRHFALRGPRPLRRSADLLLPVGPFFDDWGTRVARHPALEAPEVAAVVHALVAGWERLPGTVGYPRAIAGIQDAFPGGAAALAGHLPAKTGRALRSGLLRSLSAVPRRRFEEQWAQAALNRLTAS